MEKLWKLGQALRAGEELKDSETWKKHQQALNAILTILGFLVLFMPDEIKNLLDENTINTIAQGILAVGGIVNSYLVPATTTRIGLPAKK